MISITTDLNDYTTKFPNAPCRLLFKNEQQQPLGSFKLRGIGHLIAKLIENKENPHVYLSSGGNAGLAAAYASKQLGVPCTVVLPVTSKPMVKKSLEQLGATVLVRGQHWGEADEYTRKIATDGVYIHPFDDATIWEGHSVMVDEIVNQVDDKSKIKGIVCSFGGGGLFNGIVEGIQRNNLGCKVLVTETRQAPCFAKAIENGKLVHVDVNTVVTTLGSPYASERLVEIFKQQSVPIHFESIDDIDALRGTVDYYDLVGQLVEPLCGAALKFAFDIEKINEVFDVEKDDVIVFIVCGGTAINDELLKEYREII